MGREKAKGKRNRNGRCRRESRAATEKRARAEAGTGQYSETRKLYFGSKHG